MDGSDSERAQEKRRNAAERRNQTTSEAEANRAASGLRGQIAALRQQVKEAQETLREQERRRGKPREP